MQWVRGTWNEIVGLFVDDALFSAAIVGWLAAVAGLLRWFPQANAWSGLLLAGGLMVLLVESATRRARKSGPAK